MAGWTTVVVLTTTIILYLIKQRYSKGLHRIPGPFWASITPFDRIISAMRGIHHELHPEYHRKYGPVVRLAPNVVSFSDQGALSKVYSVNTRFQKSDFYIPFDAPTPRGVVQSMFSTRDEAVHRVLKKPIANAFSLSSMIELEPLVDECIEIMVNKLKANQEQDMDLGTFLHWFAFDVISSVTFSNRFGFLDQEKDVNNLIEAIDGRLKYNCIVGQAPWLHQYLLGNAIGQRLANLIPSFANMNTAGYMAQFAGSQVDRYHDKDKIGVEYIDILHRFKRWNGEGEEVMSHGELLAQSISNIAAGSDTTAITLRAIFYYLMKNPKTYQKLEAEIDRMDRDGKLSPIVTFDESLAMPYLQACIKEAMRLHPAIGLLLERVVPEEGVTIADKFIAGGTIIGANPWVVARDPAVYGKDFESFRPERWIEASAEELKSMDRNFLAFGAGSRVCVGKNVSLLEMSKLVPQLIRHFSIRLAHPDDEWEVCDYWLVPQRNVICRIKGR